MESLVVVTSPERAVLLSSLVSILFTYSVVRSWRRAARAESVEALRTIIGEISNTILGRTLAHVTSICYSCCCARRSGSGLSRAHGAGRAALPCRSRARRVHHHAAVSVTASGASSSAAAVRDDRCTCAASPRPSAGPGSGAAPANEECACARNRNAETAGDAPPRSRRRRGGAARDRRAHGESHNM